MIKSSSELWEFLYLQCLALELDKDGSDIGEIFSCFMKVFHGL